MKKKIPLLAGVAVALLFCICAVVYFRPLSLCDVVSENNQIKMVLNEFEVKNGEAYIDTVDYQTVTQEQKSAIIKLFEQYKYKRTLGTLFSDGSISGLGDRTLSVYVYDGTSVVGSIFISSSGSIAVDDASYNMEDAKLLIEQIIEVMG